MSGSEEGHCVLVEPILLIQGLGSKREREGELVGCFTEPVYCTSAGKGGKYSPEVLPICCGNVVERNEWLGRMRARGCKEW